MVGTALATKQPVYSSHRESREGGGGGNRRGCLSEILNLTPKGDHLGMAQAFCDPYRRPIWACLKQILTPKNKFKRKFDFCFSSRNSVFLCGTLNETLAA